MNISELESRNVGVIHENEEIDSKEKEDIEDDIKMLDPENNTKPSLLNALIPVFAVIFVAFAGLLMTGARHSYEQLLYAGAKISHYSFAKVWDSLHMLHDERKKGFFSNIGVLISNSDFYIPLLWSSFAGITFAILCTITRKDSIRSTMESMVQGFRIMLSAVIILVFAWALAGVIEDLHTSNYISSLISSKFIYPPLLPFIIFILAAMFSFGIGSIWGTMAILYPLLLPITWVICLNANIETEISEKIMYAVIASIITGSVFGNHCSPISDTTTVSAISSDCNHVTHIKTQMPYAFTVASISILLLLFSILNFHWSINYIIGIGSIFLIVKYKGKTIE